MSDSTPAEPDVERVTRMRSPEEVSLVAMLRRQGMAMSEIARRTGIPYRTVTHWVAGHTPDATAYGKCALCSDDMANLPREPYVYLLGLYLGDGCIYTMPRDVYRLAVFCANEYPILMRACAAAIGEVISNKVGFRLKGGCTEVYSYSKHWPCLFPQHGSGRKHDRKIELADWQQALVDVDPRPLIRGLIHSDGCRVLNRASGTKYPPYPRYHFTNASDDIREIFTRALDALGIDWRPNNARNISIARRASVAKLDDFVGPKR
jgi:hypothetical protein